MNPESLEISYRPGYQVRIISYPDVPEFLREFHLRVDFETVDATKPGKLTSITFEEKIPDILMRPFDPLKFAAWLRNTLVHSVEAHECDEWLKIGGKRVSNPHPDVVYDLEPKTLKDTVLTSEQRLQQVESYKQLMDSINLAALPRGFPNMLAPPPSQEEDAINREMEKSLNYKAFLDKYITHYSKGSGGAF